MPDRQGRWPIRVRSPGDADIKAACQRPRGLRPVLGTEAINGRLEHLRGSALGVRNRTNDIARSLLETGGFRRQLHPALGYASRAATLGTSYARAIRRGRRRETRQPTLNLNPGGYRFVVCGGAPCPTIVHAEFGQERCRSARSKEVSPIFVHSRVLAHSRWSL